MIIESVRARSLFARGRFDSGFFLSPGGRAAERLVVAEANGLEIQTVSSLGTVSMPGRDRKVYAVAGEESTPYLRAYDVFDYVPRPADRLSVKRASNLSALRCERGTILQTRSGRNLGPAVMVDRHLAEFALSDDLIRISVPDESQRFYLLAFLLSETGQALLRRDKTGSVIDHLSVSHINKLVVPMVDPTSREEIINAMQNAFKLRESARDDLALATAELEESIGLTRTPSSEGWGISVTSLSNRLDAAFYDPSLEGIRQSLLESGGTRLGDLATVLKPAGRYKTYYVDPENGSPILSGRQLLQCIPINLKHISTRSVDPAKYALHRGWVAFQADGRAEERLGNPILVEPSRDGWLASGHVGRLVPNEGVSSGWLYTAFASSLVQAQVVALACGSVVDALYEGDLENVILPPMRSGFEAAEEAWAKFARANVQQSSATAILESFLSVTMGME